MPPLRRHLKAWSRQDAQGRIEAIEALGMTCCVRLLLYVTPFRTLLRWMRPAAPPEPPGGPGGWGRSAVETCRDAGRRDRIARAVAAVARYVPQATCLTRSIVLFSMLRRRGYDATLTVGVAKQTNGKLNAHAWVENEAGACLPGNQPLGATLLTLRSITPNSATERSAREPARQSP